MGKWAGLGPRLREAIKERGFINTRGEADIQRFAMANGWAPTYVYRWVNGTTDPEPENIFKLAAALGVDPGWILLGKPEVAKAPARPPKRVGKVVKCLLAALGLTATAWGSGRAEALPTSFALPHYLLSELLKRLRQRGFFPVGLHPDSYRKNLTGFSPTVVSLTCPAARAA